MTRVKYIAAFVAAILIGAIVVSCVGRTSGGGFAGSAEDAAKQILVHYDKGQFGPAYDSLHPLQQHFVNREKFIQCGSQTDMNFSSVKVLETYEEPVKVPGTDKTIDSTAVTLSFKMGPGNVITTTFHVAKVGDRWTWMLADPFSTQNC